MPSLRHGRWLFHATGTSGPAAVRRDLALAVDPSLFPEIEGTTDTELLFHLALTHGLEDDPPSAMARAVGLVEAIGRNRGVQYPIQMTVATTDGETTWAFRYSSEGRSRSLFHSTDVSTLRDQYPDNPVLHELSDDARLIVSEPLGDLRGAWREVPESTCVVVRGGREELLPFTPAEPSWRLTAPSRPGMRRSLGRTWWRRRPRKPLTSSARPDRCCDRVQVARVGVSSAATAAAGSASKSDCSRRPARVPTSRRR